MSTRPNKDANFWKVLNAAMELDFRRGHLKWTVSELSRKSGITRSLIYYHFGRSKVTILEEAVRVIGEELIGLGEERMKQFQSGDWAGSVIRAREIANQSPFLVQFYLLHRNRPTEIGTSILQLEERYNAKLAMAFPERSEHGRRALYAFFFGLIFAPGIDDAAISNGIDAFRDVKVR
jgi:AcrR family transcriptional regulator